MKKGKKVIKSIFFIILFVILIPFIVVYYGIKFIVKRAKKRKWEREGKMGKRLLLEATISDIDIMEGYEFEEYLRALFFYDGYAAEVTKKSKDYGADILLEKDGERIVVQAKRYNKGVGVKSVQEALAAKAHYNATDAFVVTNSFFTAEAETLAKENLVRLIDREELVETIKTVKEKLKIDTYDGELAAKENSEIEQKFPFMI